MLLLGNELVGARMSLDTKVFGHEQVWARMPSEMSDFGNKLLWAQISRLTDEATPIFFLRNFTNI